MFNQSPQAKLNSQVQSNRTGLAQERGKKAPLGKPTIDRPKAHPVANPTPPGTPAEQEPGFTDWVSDKWNKGKEWAKDQAWKAATGYAADKMDSMLNPSDKPEANGPGPQLPVDQRPPSQAAPQPPKAQVPSPKFETPTPPKTRRPAIRAPKFRR